VKNSRPQILSKEGTWLKKNGLFAVNAITGKEYLTFTEKAKATDVAEFLTNLSLDLQKEKSTKLTIILDNNTTHKKKMKSLVKESLNIKEITDFKIEFIHTPGYSPDFNLAEYLIHQLRLKLIHQKTIPKLLKKPSKELTIT